MVRPRRSSTRQSTTPDKRMRMGAVTTVSHSSEQNFFVNEADKVNLYDLQRDNFRDVEFEQLRNCGQGEAVEGREQGV